MILITGGEGYIGKNIRKLLKSKHIPFKIVDKKNGRDAEKIKTLENYTGVIHLAAQSGIKACEDDITESTKDNILTALNMFQLSLVYNIPCVFTSSQAAKTPENSLYSMSKYFIEQQAFRINKLGGNIKIVRLANVYGGIDYLSDKNTVVSKFIKNTVNKIPLVINGNGTQMRDFIHVFDVCDALLKCLECKTVINEPIDIGTGIPTSINELSSMFKNEFTFNKKSDNIGVEFNIADVLLAKKVLGFEAKESLSNYIKQLRIC